jgi:hypothetical protein
LKTIATAMLTIAAALALAACGGGGGETTGGAAAGGTGGSTATETGAATKPSAQHRDDAARGEGQGASSGQGQGGHGSKGGSGPAAGDTSASFTPPTHHDYASGAAPFETKGGDNSIQEFGAEGSGSDFEAAATALHGYLDARAAGAWRDACSYLSPAVLASLAQLGSGGGASCPETVASLSAGVPAAALEEAAEAQVGALRIEGDRAFLLFRGAHGSDYFMPMVREGGAWKVAAIAASAVS